MTRRGLLLGATALAGGAVMPPGAGPALAAAGIAAAAPDPGAAPGNTILPVALPCASRPGDIVGLLLEGAGSPVGTVAVFGQAFRPGDLPRGAGLQARTADTGRAVRIQADVTTRHGDGSARYVVVAVELPVALPPGDRLGLVLAAASGAAGESAMDVAAALSGRQAMVEIMPAGGGTPWRFDLLAARPNSGGAGGRNGVGSGGRPWQWGPIVVQWRVATAVPPTAVGGATSLRLVADVAVQADGTLRVDAWFRNDIAQRPGGAAARYSARVLLDGVEALAFAPPGAQHQYTAIGRQLAARPGGQPAPPSPFLRADARYLAAAAAVQPHDLTTGVDRSLLQAMARLREGADWHRPFDRRGITPYMPQGGGRPDIGPMTDWQAAWLQTGEPLAAAFVIGQAEAAGGIPWHFWDTEGGSDRRGGWLSVKRWPGLWVDSRGGPPPGGLAQPMPTPSDTGWTPDLAHQPDLAYLPYLLTGRRAFLDEHLAQGAYSIINRWPVERTPPDWRGRPGADMILANGGQVRGSAWCLRQLDGAAWIVPDDDPDAPMLREAAAGNWAWLRHQIAGWTAMQGEIHGWLPGSYGDGGNMAPWQQDYLAAVVGQAARRGNADARAFLQWMAHFLIGRFPAADQGFPLPMGAAYNMAIRPPSRTAPPFRSWSEVAQATRERGLSNGVDWPAGDYVSLALQAVAQVWDVFDSPEARQAYARLIAARAPHGRPDTFAKLPNQNIVPRGTQRFPDRLRACTTAAPARG